MLRDCLNTTFSISQAIRNILNILYHVNEIVTQIFHLETYPKITSWNIIDPPEKGGFTGGGKGMDIFFNSRPMMMIQNENLLYNNQRICLLHNHTHARLCAPKINSIESF